MTNQNIQLNIGDEIGFVRLAQNCDDNDRTIYFPVVEISRQNGELAYRYQYPDGEISRSYVLQSNLQYHSLRINSQAVEMPTAPASTMISLVERKAEFIEAMKRGQDNRLEIFNDWDRDSFYVKNCDSGKEYNVILRTENGETFGKCSCKDFYWRKRVCKHLAEVVSQSVFGLAIQS